RHGKGDKDRLVPLPTSMYEELRRYWAFHRHPLLIFPNVGRGDHDPKSLAQRMRQANCPMPCSSLQRLLIVARKQLNIRPPRFTPCAKMPSAEKCRVACTNLLGQLKISFLQLFDSAFPECPLSRTVTNTETKKDIHDSSVRV